MPSRRWPGHLGTRTRLLAISTLLSASGAAAAPSEAPTAEALADRVARAKRTLRRLEGADEASQGGGVEQHAQYWHQYYQPQWNQWHQHWNQWHQHWNQWHQYYR